MSSLNKYNKYADTPIHMTQNGWMPTTSGNTPIDYQDSKSRGYSLGCLIITLIVVIVAISYFTH